MNPTPNQITECDDEKVLCEWAAVYCMGWTEIPEHHDGFKVFECNQHGYIRDWQPTSPTEKGKSQCWDLMVKFNLRLGCRTKVVAYPSTFGIVHFSYEDGDEQIAVVKAALLSAIGE